MTGRRGLVVAVLLVAGGGLLVLLSAGRVWGHAALPAATGNTVHVSATGHQVAGSLPALGVALAALALAVVAARRRLRRVVAVVVLVTAAATAAVAVGARGDVGAELARRAFGVQVTTVHTSPSPWWVVAVLGAVLALVGAVATLLWSGRWPGMGGRYESPAARRPLDVTTSAWEALDRGEDPTA